MDPLITEFGLFCPSGALMGPAGPKMAPKFGILEWSVNIGSEPLNRLNT